MFVLRLAIVAVISFMFSITLIVLGGEFGVLAGFAFFGLTLYGGWRLAKYSLNRY